MDNLSINYKVYHEEFMQNQNGTTYNETFSAVTPMFVSILISVLIAFAQICSNISYKASAFFGLFIAEFCLVVFIPILCFTILSDAISLVVVTLLTISLTIVYCHRDSERKVYFDPASSFKKPFITNFRGSTNVLTAICILAVDFRIFPRKFAKTETFGYALMDTGVGLFCVANSLVSPLQSNHRKSPSQHFLKSLKGCVILILLGGIRFFTTKEMDYQVHISEYGVHWNFFITLGFTKLLSSAVMCWFNSNYLLYISFVIIGIHELFLYYVQDWVLSDTARDTFLNANREGIVSTLGYVALYLAGIGLGYKLNTTEMSLKEKFNITLKLFALSMLSWFGIYVTQNYFRISRRLANMGYFIWILTFSTTTLSIFLFMEVFLSTLFTPIPYTKRTEGKEIAKSLHEIYVPVLLSAVNFNGLAFFLLANLGTGLVNVCVKTLFVDTFYSIVIITLYMFIVCLCTFILYFMNIKLNF